MKLIMLIGVLMGFIIMVGVFFFLISVSIEIVFGFRIVKWLDAKYTQFKRCRKDVKLEKEFEKKKKALEKKLQKEYSISFDVLKFEYATVHNIVNNEIPKLMNEHRKKQVIITDMYLISLYELHQDVSKIRKISNNSLEFFTCLWIALKDLPVFYTSGDSSLAKALNNILIRNVLEALKEHYSDIYYNNILVTKESIPKILYMCSEDTMKYYSKKYNFGVVEKCDDYFFDRVKRLILEKVIEFE